MSTAAKPPTFLSKSKDHKEVAEGPNGLAILKTFRVDI